MAIDFESIIKDSNTYPDNLEITLGNEKVQLGAIRDLSKRQQAKVTEELSRLEAERTGLSAKQKEALQLTEKATEIYNNLQAQLEAAKRNSGGGGNRQDGLDPEALFDQDPWYAPVRKRYSTIEENQKKLTEQLKMVGDVIKGAVNTFMEDRWEQEWNSTADRRLKSKAIKDWDFEKIKKYAEENKVVDRRGIPSIRAAVERLTAAELEEAKANEAYERGLREGELRSRLGAQPRPASAAAAAPGGKSPATLDEALSPESIAEDKELSEMLSNLGVPLQ